MFGFPVPGCHTELFILILPNCTNDYSVIEVMLTFVKARVWPFVIHHETDKNVCRTAS